MQISLAPNPRYRIYTRFASYFAMVKDLLQGRVNTGDDVGLLEEAIAKKFNIGHAVCVPMCRSGIFLTIKHTIKPGQEVILSPYTIADVVNMVICAGGVPVFADIEANTCNIDPAQVVKLISQNTGAVLVTHLHGLAAPVKEIQKVCEKFAVPLIEDCAQAFGAAVNGQRVGTFGRAGVYSFGMYKNINTWYGGAVVSDDRQLIEKICGELSSKNFQKTQFILKRLLQGLTTDLATLPMIFKFLTFWVFRFGFLHDIDWINKKVAVELDLSRIERIPEHYLARMTPHQARLALMQLGEIDEFNNVRVAKGQLYHQGLSNFTQLTLPPKVENGSHIFTYYPVRTEGRLRLLKWLMKNKRDVAAQHLKNCADLPAFKDFYRNCPNARATAEELLILPTYPRYTDQDIQKNIQIIGEFFSGNL
jgi:perosamine synthetase